MSFLVDTNVVSELCRGRVNPGVVSWAQRVRRICLSAVTVEEIEFGLAARPNDRVREWFARFMDSQCEVLAVTDAVARCSGHLRGDSRRRGHPRTQADMLIAATALVNGLTLVTRNESDFRGCGVVLLNPFT